MSIIRAPRLERNFTIVSNSLCLDPRLSMRGLGLLVRLLSRPDNWSTNSEALAREFDCGRDQMRAVLRELADAGYMQLRKERDASGQFSSKWYVFDEPQHTEKANPDDGKPGTGNPYAGDSGPITRTDLTRTDNNPPTPKGECVANAFGEFWKAYPKKVGKDAAESAWKRKVRTLETVEAIRTALVTKTSSEDWTKEDGKYVPNPATWLNQGRWKDEEGGSAAADPFRGAL